MVPSDVLSPKRSTLGHPVVLGAFMVQVIPFFFFHQGRNRSGNSFGELESF
jgi:hypothetical protein